MLTELLQVEVLRLRSGQISAGNLLYHLYTFLKSSCWGYQQTFFDFVLTHSAKNNFHCFRQQKSEDF